MNNLYLVTIFTPSFRRWQSREDIHTQYNVEAKNKNEIMDDPKLQSTIKALKAEYPNTHYTVEAY